jgi:hypothetical protein
MAKELPRQGVLRPRGRGMRQLLPASKIRSTVESGRRVSIHDRPVVREGLEQSL